MHHYAGDSAFAFRQVDYELNHADDCRGAVLGENSASRGVGGIATSNCKSYAVRHRFQIYVLRESRNTYAVNHLVRSAQNWQRSVSKHRFAYLRASSALIFISRSRTLCSIWVSLHHSRRVTTLSSSDLLWIYGQESSP